MDDFRASAPEQRGPANPNVESIPFEDMKERILKIVKGYNGWVLGTSLRRGGKTTAPWGLPWVDVCPLDLGFPAATNWKMQPSSCQSPDPFSFFVCGPLQA